MPSLFGRKKPTTTTPASTQADRNTNPPPTPPAFPAADYRGEFLPIVDSPPSSPEKKKNSKDYIGKQRERNQKERKPRPSSRTSKSFTGRASATSSRKSFPIDLDEHPLNLPPDELRRLSALTGMGSPARENGTAGRGMENDRMDESTPAPDGVPGAFPQHSSQTTGVVNGDHPPPSVPAHRSPPPEEPKIDAEACKAAGNGFYKAGKYAAAIAEYTKAIDADPQSSTYLSNRAAAYMAANQYAEALEDCKAADEREPNNAKILHRLAKVYVALGQPQEALNVYDRIEPAPAMKDRAPAQNMQTHISQAADSLQTGTSGSMISHALDMAERGLGVGVQAPRKWKLMRGEAYLRMGNVNSLGDAQNVAMSLLRANNADPEALVLRGRALYAQGENDKAIQHFRQALACDPDYKDAVKYLRMVQKLDRMKEEGNGHFKLGRYQQAVDVYTAALEVDPLNKGTNSKILNNRAMCYSKQKQYQSAIEDCDKAIQMDPSYTKARRTRAKALGDVGDWEEAVRALKSIAEQSPEEPGIAKEIRNAELELKKSQRKDYYKILGVEKDAGEREIKSAYKRLAVRHHPDKNIGDPDAEARFKDIQEAHETLIDPEKRERYDSGVDLMEPGQGFGGHPFGGGMGGMGGHGVQIDPEVLFSFLGGQGGGGGGHPFGGMGGMPRGGGSQFRGGGFSPFG